MTMTGKQKRHLRALAHDLKAVVSVGGKGLSDAVLAEIDNALDHHELIKIKLPALARPEKEKQLDAICDATGAEQVQLVGRIGVLFRAAEPTAIELPK